MVYNAMIKVLLLVGSGSFFGGIARYLSARVLHLYFPMSFPLGTFLVNVAGCFIIGLLYGLSERGEILSADARLFLMAGFCGGFTTFSAFSGETLSLLRDGNYLQVGLYVVASVVVGLLATWLGTVIIKSI
jgi:fluoride exporter